MDKRFVSAMLLGTTLLVAMLYVRQRFFPPKPLPDQASASAPAATKPEQPAEPPKADAPQVAAPEPAKPWQDEDIVLGGQGDSKLKVILSKRGAAVRTMTLANYGSADRFTAKPLAQPPTDAPLVLVSDGPEGTESRPPAGLKPEDYLARQSYRLTVDGRDLDWEVIGQKPNQVTFAATVPGKAVKVIKTFSLSPDQYHVVMDVKFQGQGGKAAIAYDLTGPHGIPIEGEYWKTAPYRTAVLGTVKADDPRYAIRHLYDPRTLDPKRLNKAEPFVLPDPARPEEFQFAGVMNQFFAALAVVDARGQDPARERPILKVTPEYLGDDPDFVKGNEQVQGRVGVRLTSRPIALEGDAAVAHRYLLYAGPAKVLLLGYEPGVEPGLADRYLADYHLRVLTDYHSDNWLARAFAAIGWTSLLITCTNFMHFVMEWLHVIAPNYGVTIILLTLLVRVLMFPVSRKQAISMQRMQKLQPEITALQEKYKDDRQQLAQAQMELYRKHGVNPLGGCLPMLIQMPIFMGLYYALNESVHLRLSGTLWSQNLAAPDMLFRWDHWPVFGALVNNSWIRFGPFFNLLPLISMVLIMIQQRLTMPKAVTEEQRAQQAAMSLMMPLMGYMFYWVASGLCIYFIISSAWGMVERKFLPKAAAAAGAAAAPDKKAGGERPRRDRGRAAGRNGDAGTLGKLSAWWTNLLRQAEKK